MKYAAILLLITMSACFSAMETAFSSVNKIRLRHLAAEGNKKAENALKIAENFDRALTTILIGNNIVNILSASLGTIIFTEIFGASGVAVATAVMTVLVLIFGEIMPKSIAKQNPERFVMGFEGMLRFIMLIFTPVSALFMLLQRSMANINKPSDAPSVTEDELKYIINESESEGVLEEKESNLVRSALEFDEITIEEILVPRVKIVAIEKNDDIDTIMQLFINERYSRLPVYDKTIDNIIGVVNEKDFFALYELSKNKPASIESIIRKTLYISEMKIISEVLNEMQRTKLHMAIVKDQYGGTSGIVTLEDIIEELVGEIYDENDDVVQSFVKVGENMYEVMAELSMTDLLEKLGLPENAADSESTSVGGWVIELFGRIPETGEAINSGIFSITVLETEGNAITKVGIKINVGENEEKD